MGKYYLTTPIYYVNDAPHIGTAYCTIAADAIARYQRLKGSKVLFSTGVDENGLKIVEAAQKQGRDAQPYVDKMAGVLYEKGDIYQDTYEGWYCLSDETFFRESELVEGRCPNPECRREVEWLGEKGYFFRLSKYAEPLLQYIEVHPDFLQPDFRKNEVVAFIKGGLKDTCVSRAAAWGIPLPPELPDAEGMVVYVWLDALVNYLTIAGYPDDPAKLAEFWPADMHLVGKDIFVRFHATMWPAVLLAAGLPLPKTVFAHGFLTVGGEKISKSKGNKVDPLEVVEQIRAISGCRPEMALDALRYFLLREMTFGLDGAWSVDAIIGRFNADLANDLGNLLNRLLPLIIRHNEGKIPAPAEDEAVTAAAKEAIAGWEASMDRYDFSSALRSVWGYLSFLNRWIDSQAPWSLAKQGKKAEVDKVFYCLAESLRIVTILITPVMPNAAAAIQKQLGLSEMTLAWPEAVAWGQLPGGTQVNVGEPLFPRVQKPK